MDQVSIQELKARQEREKENPLFLPPQTGTAL